MNNLKKYSYLLFLLITCYSCKRTVHGEGPVISETRDINHISEIELSIPANITLIEADSFNCVIGAQQNILDLIKTKSGGDELTIGSSRNFNTEKPVQIVISLPKVSALTVNGSGEIAGINGLNDKTLELEVNGSGKIKLKGKISDVESTINGSGEIYLEGKCEQQKLSINGSGDFHGYGFESADIKISINGSANAEVSATNELKAEITGSGNIRYKGNPHLKSDITGSGTIQKTE